MRFTYLAPGRTNNCLLFLLNKTHNHSFRRHDSSCNFILLRKRPFSSKASAIKPTSGNDGCAVDGSSSTPSSPTVSYLIQKCGLSVESAISASKKFELKFPKKSDSMLQLLRDHGLTDGQITALIIKCPRILSSQTDRNLKPKLEFLFSEGFTHLQVFDLLSKPSTLLNNSLERKIIPSMNFLRTILPSNAAITKFLRLSTNIISSVQLANMEILRSVGAPEAVIRKIFIAFPRSITLNHKYFAKAVEKSMDLGFEPCQVSLFANSVGVLSYMKQSTWERKMMIYRRLGWSQEETLLLFKKSPLCFGLSDRKIEDNLNFFTKNLGYSRKRLISNTVLLQMSLEKRIIPRVSILSLLAAEGFIKTIAVTSLIMPEAKFLAKFVNMYKDRVPEVVEAYRVHRRVDSQRLH